MKTVEGTKEGNPTTFDEGQSENPRMQPIFQQVENVEIECHAYVKDGNTTTMETGPKYQEKNEEYRGVNAIMTAGLQSTITDVLKDNSSGGGYKCHVSDNVYQSLDMGGSRLTKPKHT